MFQPLKMLGQPIFAEVIRLRSLSMIVAGAGALQLGLSRCFNVGFPCAFHQFLGIPCPGCGLTRSVLALFRGDLTGSFYLHPFGVPLLAGLVVSLAASVMPARGRERLVKLLEKIEIRTGITMILLIVFMLVWGLRITGLVHLASV